MDFITALWKKISFPGYLLKWNKCKGKIQQVKVNKKNILTSISYRIWGYTNEWACDEIEYYFLFIQLFVAAKCFAIKKQQVENWKSLLFSQRWSTTSKRKLCYLLFSKQKKNRKNQNKITSIIVHSVKTQTSILTHLLVHMYVREKVCVCLWMKWYPVYVFSLIAFWSIPGKWILIFMAFFVKCKFFYCHHKIH